MARGAWLVVPALVLLLGDDCDQSPPPMAEPVETLPGSATVAWRATVSLGDVATANVTKIQDGATSCYIVRTISGDPAISCVREAP